MSEIIFLTYADDTYQKRQQNLSARAREFGMYSVSKTREQLAETEFYKIHKSMMDEKRGGGFWLWKPYFIFSQLLEMKAGDILLYTDCGDWIDNNPVPFLQQRMKDCDMLLTMGGYPNKDWTKRDCFVMMGCDEEKYHDIIQVEAGIIIIKKSFDSMKWVAEWLKWAQNENILTDLPNICGKENLPGFRDHRHDQSILTNLKVKYDIPYSNEIRNHITCNVNESYR